MNKKEIITAIKQLSTSQGTYQRLYEIIFEGGDNVDCFLNDLEEKNFKDVVDLILYLEG